MGAHTRRDGDHSFLAPTEHLQRIERFVCNDLPVLNRNSRDGQLPLAGWLGLAREIVRGAETTAGLLDAAGRLRLLQLGGLLAASAERLAQGRGAAPGDVLRTIPGRMIYLPVLSIA